MSVQTVTVENWTITIQSWTVTVENWTITFQCLDCNGCIVIVEELDSNNSKLDSNSWKLDSNSSISRQ